MRTLSSIIGQKELLQLTFNFRILILDSFNKVFLYFCYFLLDSLFEFLLFRMHNLHILYVTLKIIWTLLWFWLRWIVVMLDYNWWNWNLWTVSWMAFVIIISYYHRATFCILIIVNHWLIYWRKIRFMFLEWIWMSYMLYHGVNTLIIFLFTIFYYDCICFILSAITVAFGEY